jgi:hypothetical protein
VAPFAAAFFAGAFGAFLAVAFLAGDGFTGDLAGAFAAFAPFFGAPRGRVESGGVTVAS